MFALIACAFAAGLIAGVLARGRLAGLATLHLRWAWVLIVALFVSLIPLFWSSIGGSALAKSLMLVSNLGVIGFLLMNVAQTRDGVRLGLSVAGIGWLLNFVVIAVNGVRMPLSMWAYRASGQCSTVCTIDSGKGGFFKVYEANSHTIFRFLGDVIPLRLVTQVVSIGDLCLLVGIVIVIASAMRQRRAVGAPVEA